MEAEPGRGRPRAARWRMARRFAGESRRMRGLSFPSSPCPGRKGGRHAPCAPGRTSPAGAYSVRSATTGSFFAALLEGIIPEKRVRAMLIKSRVRAASGGRKALSALIPVK